jgi:nucleotide-binding universal stress UspA family protein
MTHDTQIVVGYDFSHTGHVALRRGVEIASRAPSHVLHVLCVLDPRSPIPSIPTDTGVDHLYASRVQEALAVTVAEQLDAARVHTRVQFCVHARIGKAADEILALAREVGAALVIVGSHGLSALERLLVGSTSAKVARNAGCTVEIARERTYPDVELATIVDVETDHPHRYIPPHRYSYEDHRVMHRPADWPLW